MNLFKGYLSYGLAALAIGGGAAGFIMGVIDAPTATGMIWAGLAVFGIRRAVSN